MKTLSVFLLLFLTQGQSIFGQTPNPGPYYFVSDNVNGFDQFYGNKDSYSGVVVLEGYNLLAHLLGDVPRVNRTQTLVAPASFEYGPDTIHLQPFAFTIAGSNRKRNLPIGTNLRNFLDAPLGNADFDLSLPFKSEKVALSNRSALLRDDNSVRCWHSSIDFDRTDDVNKGFDVVAAADGVVERNNSGSSIYVIRHTASNGKQFLTIYQHLDGSSKNSLNQGDPIKRGDFIGRVEEPKDDNGNPDYAHLHFSVAVRGPSKTIRNKTVPECWFLVDPFGVYDYRRNSKNTATYNYLPNNSLSFALRGRIHKQVFRTNVPANSLFVSAELEVGESKTVTVSANKVHDATGIFMRSGQTFRFNTSSPAWNNGSTETDCDGYNGNIADNLRRHPDLKMMVLTGEIFKENNGDNYTGEYFRIGCGPRNVTVGKTGYLICFANDILLGYGDNSRVVTLTVTRTQ